MVRWIDWYWEDASVHPVYGQLYRMLPGPKTVSMLPKKHPAIKPNIRRTHRRSK